MKGILLAGGLGTRLYPLTRQKSKHLLNVCGKPMIYYPLWVLMQVGIRQILIISTKRDIGEFRKLLGDGMQFGLELSYAVQESPQGIAQALLIGEEFIGESDTALILGDNFFAGPDISEDLRNAADKLNKYGGSVVLCTHTEQPERFGILETNDAGNPVSIEEKPIYPKSSWCVTGLYFYDHKAAEYAKNLKPSIRGELEITELNNTYLRERRLNAVMLAPGSVWMDMGSFEGIKNTEAYLKNTDEETTAGSLKKAALENNWIA